MTNRTKNVLGLILFAAFAAVAVWLIRRSHREKLRAIDAVPANAFLVVTLDVDLLRKSPLAAPLLEGPGARILGGKSVAETCGFDPVERMREIAVAVPVEDDTGEFGIVVRADVTRDELVECARKVILSRGGSDKATIRQSGSFTLVEPEAVAAKRYPTLAYREGGPFLVARGPWLDTMIDTTEGKLPSVRRESKHLTLRRGLGVSSDDLPTYALVATVVLPKDMREHIKKDMAEEVAGQPGDGNAAALMGGVLGVEAAGLGLSAGDIQGEETRVVVDLFCEDEAACAAVGRFIDKKRRDWASDPSVRMLGIGVVLDSLSVENRGKSLRVSAHAPAPEVSKWVERVTELRSWRHPTGKPLEEDAGARVPAP